MHWQDFIFSAGSIVFIIALLPVFKRPEKPPVFTSALTGGVLFIYATICYSTLGLWYSFATTLLLACMWLAIGLQQLTVNRRQRFDRRARKDEGRLGDVPARSKRIT